MIKGMNHRGKLITKDEMKIVLIVSRNNIEKMVEFVRAKITCQNSKGNSFLSSLETSRTRRLTNLTL